MCHHGWIFMGNVHIRALLISDAIVKVLWMLTICIRGIMTDSQQQQLTDTSDSYFLTTHRSLNHLIDAHWRSKRASVHLHLGDGTAVAAAQVALLAMSFRNQKDRCFLPAVWKNLTVFWSRDRLAQKEEHLLTWVGWPYTLVYLRLLLMPGDLL